MKICRNTWQVHPFIANLEESKAFQGPLHERKKVSVWLHGLPEILPGWGPKLVIDMRMQNATLRLEH